MFNNNAVGFITKCGKENKLINAKYPLAPPCPTLEYKKDIKGNMSRKIQICSISKINF